MWCIVLDFLLQRLHHFRGSDLTKTGSDLQVVVRRPFNYMESKKIKNGPQFGGRRARESKQGGAPNARRYTHLCTLLNGGARTNQAWEPCPRSSCTDLEENICHSTMTCAAEGQYSSQSGVERLTSRLRTLYGFGYVAAHNSPGNAFSARTTGLFSPWRERERERERKEREKERRESKREEKQRVACQCTLSSAHCRPSDLDIYLFEWSWVDAVSPEQLNNTQTQTCVPGLSDVCFRTVVLRRSPALVRSRSRSRSSLVGILSVLRWSHVGIKAGLSPGHDLSLLPDILRELQSDRTQESFVLQLQVKFQEREKEEKRERGERGEKEIDKEREREKEGGRKTEERKEKREREGEREREERRERGGGERSEGEEERGRRKREKGEERKRERGEKGEEREKRGERERRREREKKRRGEKKEKERERRERKDERRTEKDKERINQRERDRDRNVRGRERERDNRGRNK
ncbi:hypothetical protein WMY93_007378 [Mugilogobius chulae]|uniref:Uncharacterized protein n=1 Tax=Mugilogobius chulae TaxID=88201 RepID=A0AAW0PCS6_9GOBI